MTKVKRSSGYWHFFSPASSPAVSTSSCNLHIFKVREVHIGRSATGFFCGNIGYISGFKRTNWTLPLPVSQSPVKLSPSHTPSYCPKTSTD